MGTVACLLVLVVLAAAQGDGEGHRVPDWGKTNRFPVRDVRGMGQVVGLGYDTVDVFHGIRYGEPPTGRNRWKAPRPARYTQGVHEAFYMGKACPMSNCGWDENEDCLFLNVYAPRCTSSHCPPLPVMVWIHGGAFSSGCAAEFNATSLASTGAVIVTLDYRLGVFGFLGADELRNSPNESTGNFGMLDQRLAIEWVRKHIADFNGDPERITLFGQSAGGASVAYHMVTERSHGLFHKAILQSGGFAPWEAKSLSDSTDTFYEVLYWTGCLWADDAVRCLEDLPTNRLVKAAGQMAVMPMREGNDEIPLLPVDSGLTWAPTVDGVELKGKPWKLLSEGKYAKSIPVIIGTTVDETSSFYSWNPSDLSRKAFRAVVESLFQSFSTSERKTVEDFYNSDGSGYPCTEFPCAGRSKWWWASMRLQTDLWFTCPARRAARWISQEGADVFSFIFAHHMTTYKRGAVKRGVLVEHSSDLPFLFCDRAICGPWLDQEEEVLSNAMARYWTSFATSGSPNHPRAPLQWPQYEKERDEVLWLDVASPHGKGIHTTPHSRSAACNMLEGLSATRLQPRSSAPSPSVPTLFAVSVGVVTILVLCVVVWFCCCRGHSPDAVKEEAVNDDKELDHSHSHCTSVTMSDSTTEFERLGP